MHINSLILTCATLHVLALGMETHLFDSCIRCHHASKDPWTPVINEELVCAQESGNPHDPYAVAINLERKLGCWPSAQKNFSRLFAVLTASLARTVLLAFS